jgi:hypothetical protein
MANVSVALFIFLCATAHRNDTASLAWGVSLPLQYWLQPAAVLQTLIGPLRGYPATTIVLWYAGFRLLAC